jgi:hypothetical protein
MVVGACIVVGLAVGYFWKERVGYRNLRACRTLSPGISLSGLVRELGTPVDKWESLGKQWVSFETPSIMAGMIKAQVDEKTGNVLVLRCFEDGPPTWTIQAVDPAINELNKKIISAVRNLYYRQASGKIEVLVKQFDISDEET